MQDSFCSLPWVGIDISAQGQFKPCCKYSQSLGDRLDHYLSSDHLAQLQADFLDNKKPPGCKRCWDDEAAGLHSKRQLDQQYVLDRDLARDGVKILAMTFGNTCNLACVTCNSFASSRWAQEESKLTRQFPSWTFNHRYSHNRSYRDPDFMRQLLQVSDQLIHLEISGGEPFYAAADTHKEFLQSLPNPHNIKIHYITNATVFPDEEFWEIWQVFRQIDIQLSLDGTQDRFQYLRWPADWSKVDHNIARYQERSHIQISISHTVSWLNLIYLNDFMTWCRDRRLPDPYLGPVAQPHHLSVKCLPPLAKRHIRHQLCGTSPEMDRMLDFMDQEDLSHHWPRAQQWVQMLDRTRSISMESVFPELMHTLDQSIRPKSSVSEIYG